MGGSHIGRRAVAIALAVLAFVATSDHAEAQSPIPRLVEQDGRHALMVDGAPFLILGGQVRGGEPRLFMIYPEGNFVEACDDTPFFQIGETKYGKPILVRAYDPAMTFEAAVKLLMLSFDSTVKANLSVGMPLDVHIYEADTYRHGYIRRIAADDPFYTRISSGWGDKLREAVNSLPDYSFE